MRLITRISAVGAVVALAAGLTAPIAVAGEGAAERPAQAGQAGQAGKVALKANRSTVEAGAKLVLRGQVRPAAQRTRVAIQKRVAGGKWRAEKTVRTNGDGAFKYVDRPHTPGPRWYRAVARDVGRPGAVTSRPVRVTVLAWTDLVTYRARRTDNVRVWTDVRIKSHEFARSVSSYRGAASGSADWNLPSGCTKLRVRIGAGDDSDEGAVAHIVLRGDRKPLFSGSFTLTQSTVRTFDVSDVFRLEFSWSSTAGGADPAPGAQAVLASPQLLCAS